MLDFPSSPSAGQVFGRYEFVSPAWKKRAAKTATRRNRLVNGAMLISQQNSNTAGTINGYYPVDQWWLNFSGMGTTAVSVAQNATRTPNGSANRLRLTVTTGGTPTSTGICRFQQKIEGLNLADFGWGTASAKQAILRFGFKGPAGTYSIALGNGAGNRSYCQNFTISAGQANIDTEQVFVIPGDVTGTWATDTTIGVTISITFASGSNWLGVAGWQAGDKLAGTGISNNVATTSSVIDLFDVGLYLDPDNTSVPPKWEAVDEGAEIMACQRYWYFASCTSIAGGNSATQVMRPGMRHPVEMRVGPTVSVVGTPICFDGVNCNVSATIPYNGSNETWFDTNFTVATGLTPGRAAVIYNGAIPTIGFAISARM